MKEQSRFRWNINETAQSVSRLIFHFTFGKSYLLIPRYLLTTYH